VASFEEGLAVQRIMAAIEESSTAKSALIKLSYAAQDPTLKEPELTGSTP
jgi:hypothetical protein